MTGTCHTHWLLLLNSCYQAGGVEVIRACSDALCTFSGEKYALFVCLYVDSVSDTHGWVGGLKESAELFNWTPSVGM